MKKRTPRELFVDIITLPRTLMATADFSGVLRQGALLSARHPRLAGKALVQSSKAFFSQNTADEIDIAIRKHEFQPIREKAGLKVHYYILLQDAADLVKEVLGN